jgi:hypothetical protein
VLRENLVIVEKEKILKRQSIGFYESEVASLTEYSKKADIRFNSFTDLCRHLMLRGLHSENQRINNQQAKESNNVS